VDRRAAVGRNPQVHANAPQPTLDTTATIPALDPADVVMVDVVVLSGDLALYDAIRYSVGERNPVWRARSAAEAVDLLLTGRCGVLLLDLASVSSQPSTLVEQIVDQFPDVVVVVAGQREDEPVLAGLISDGLVYRFMHKPLSPRRAGMFLQAAMRAHVERREGRAGDYLMPLVRELRSRVDPRKWLFVGSGLALFVALLAGLLIARYGPHPGTADPAGPPAARPAKPAPAAPLADPVLSRARAALAAGRYDSPPGRNALDLYAAALLSRPDDVEAQAGLATTITRLLRQAERAAATGNPDEARRIAERVLGVQDGHPGARSLLAGLESPPRPLAVPDALPSATPADLTDSATGALPRAVTVAKPSAEATTVPAQPRRAAMPRVQKDPLTPVVVGNGTLPTSPGRRTTAAVPRQYGGPASSGHPIAGYVQRAPNLVVATTPLPDRDLEPVSTPEPAYPPAAFRDGVEGWVELDYTVTEQGTVRDVEVVSAEPGGVFDAAAVAAVAAWRYRPRVVNGRPVMERSSVTLSFNVAD